MSPQEATAKVRTRTKYYRAATNDLRKNYSKKDYQHVLSDASHGHGTEIFAQTLLLGILLRAALAKNFLRFVRNFGIPEAF
eukprot:1626548-Pleurochrysis_carterae.AAC.1